MFKDLKSDIIAGFNVFLLALPLCLGIAIASQFPPTSGIIAAIIGGVITSFFSGAPLSIKGPAAGLIAITLAAVDQLGGADLGLGYERTLAVGVVAASLQILIAWMRKAVLAEIIPPSVIHGMLAAIGVIIVSKQSYVMLGLQPGGSSTLNLILHFPKALLQMNPLILLLGLLSFLLLIFWPRFKKLAVIPSTLIMLLILIPTALLLNMNVGHEYTIGNKIYHLGPEFLIRIPNNLIEAIRFPDFSVILSATSIKFIILFTLIGSIESLLTVFALDGIQKNGKPSNVNKDLLAVGIGNLLSACIGGLPMISEVVRSKANIEFGAKTAKSNFFHGFFMLIAVLLLSSVLNLIPLAALAALLVFVGIKLASPKEFIHAYKVGLDQLCIFCTTFIFTLLSDLLIGVIAGILLKLIFHIVRNRQILSLFAPKLKATYQNGVLCIDVNGPLIFIGYAIFLNLIEKNIENTKKQGQEVTQIQIILSEVTFLDHTILQKLGSLPEKFPGIDIVIYENKALIPFSKHPMSTRMLSLNAKKH